MSEHEYLTITEAATYLNIKVKTLYALKDKKPGIPYYRLGRLIRFRKKDLDAWMERQRVGGGSRADIARRGSKPQKTTALEIGGLVRRAIDDVKSAGYSEPYGKSDQVEGSGKEV
jgi:excisionase family DNA binding protein